MALLGAGLSASSGLSTFRGVGSDGLWQNHDPAKLATPQAFAENPELVWRFYQDRRQQSLEAQPNKAHVALAKLSEQLGTEGFLCLSMNIDGLCIRASHPKDQLLELHGSLFNLKCANKECVYVQTGNFDVDLLSGSNLSGKSTTVALPTCPKCQSFLRPDIVWFTEPLPKEIIATADEYIESSEKSI